MSLLSGGRVHFIGIGGAGMSAIAKVLVERGMPVSGSDLKRSRAVTALSAMGAPVHIGHEASQVEGAEVVVVSSAIRESNPELAAARAAGMKILSRGEALAALLSDRRSIIVAGTHGKTSTTSMIVSVLRAAHLDPTYLVGGGLNDSGTNARSGSGDLAVAEADESDGSFLLLAPTVSVVTNVEEDHVDHWASLDELRAAFRTFLGATDPQGASVVPVDDATLLEDARSTGVRVITFGDEGDVSAAEIGLRRGGSSFLLRHDGHDVAVELRVPGRHNVSNALAAAAACVEVGVDLGTVAAGLRSYSGVERRFHIKGSVDGVTVIDDYAHHPTEVRATLAAARSGGWDRVVAVFQPHRYSRTAAFAAAFGAAFGDADRVVVTDVYGAGEEPVPGVSGKMISDAVCAALPGRPVAYLPHRDELVSYLGTSLRRGDALLTMGAGDVTALGDELLARWGTGA
ncbi:MAG TPA: UDP-N-acetylmuramate--L-alanine ligase [Actinomycetota bacterium]|nr:UDP-N-acetylmuramate--L-alanine ligase [Actinomycetota bacterium]